MSDGPRGAQLGAFHKGQIAQIEGNKSIVKIVKMWKITKFASSALACHKSG